MKHSPQETQKGTEIRVSSSVNFCVSCGKKSRYLTAVSIAPLRHVEAIIAGGMVCIVRVAEINRSAG